MSVRDRSGTVSEPGRAEEGRACHGRGLAFAGAFVVKMGV